MIILPTRKRLERRRDALYRKLHNVLHVASIMEVESIMRKIHAINLRLRTYFKNTNDETDQFDTEDFFEEPTNEEIEREQDLWDLQS